MKRLIAQPDRYERIDDPFKTGIYARICFISKSKYIDKQDLTYVVADKTFLFIHDNIMYFQPAIYQAA